VSAVVRWSMPQACPNKPTALERQLRPEAYERRRDGYLDRG
jgi:hypothetical protein